MTLNAVIARILRFLRNSTDFQADYMTVVEDRPIMFVNHCLPIAFVLLLAKTITHPAARSLCDSWASCYYLPSNNVNCFYLPNASAALDI